MSSPTPHIAIITGANKGIGLAIVRNLALSYPASALAHANPNAPFLIYLTARDPKRGEQAVQSLHQDPQLKKAKALAEDGGLTSIKFHELDIEKEESIKAFAEFLRGEHGSVDTVVNNAGIAPQDGDLPAALATLAVNYHGTLSSTLTFLPLLTPHGRIINVSSFLASLSGYPPHLATRFRTATSPAQITQLMDEYLAAVKEGKVWVEGKSVYDVSKAGCTGVTRVVALEERERERKEGKGERREGGRLINSCCPGYVKTDLSPGGTKSPDEGARTPVLLALGDIGGQTGLFWKNEVVIDW